MGSVSEQVFDPVSMVLMLHNWRSSYVYYIYIQLDVPERVTFKLGLMT